jgi:hypothetical protein
MKFTGGGHAKKFLSSLLTDLRERQILPAVVVLVVLAIAIPIAASVALSSSAAPSPLQVTPVALAPPHGVPAPATEITVAQVAPQTKSVVYKGAEPDPFRTAPASASAKASPATTNTSGTAPSTVTKPTPPTTVVTPTKPSTPAEPKPSVVKSTTPTTGPATLSSKAAYTVDVQTTYGSQKDTLDDVQRLTPLPSNSPAEIVYLGVLQGGQRAVFLLTGAVPNTLKLSKSVTCFPTRAECEIAVLNPGDQVEVLPAAGQKGVKSFTLVLGDISDESYSSAAEATSSRSSVAQSGQLLVSGSSLSELQNFVYHVGLGALVFDAQGGGTTTGASGGTGTSGATGPS